MAHSFIGKFRRLTLQLKLIICHLIVFSHVLFEITAFNVRTVWETGFTIEPRFLCPSILSQLFVLVWWSSIDSRRRRTAPTERRIFSLFFFVLHFFPSGCLISPHVLTAGAFLQRRTMVTEGRRRQSLEIYCRLQNIFRVGSLRWFNSAHYTCTAGTCGSYMGCHFKAAACFYSKLDVITQIYSIMWN